MANVLRTSTGQTLEGDAFSDINSRISQAQSDASQGVNDAANAQAAANTAQSTADNAQGSASAAQTSADAAQTTADNAQSTANDAAAAAAAAASDASTALAGSVVVKKCTLTLALLQAAGSLASAAFVLTTLPVNARLLGCEALARTVLAGPSLTTATATVEANGDPAGTIMGSVTVKVGGINSAAGSAKYFSRGTAQINMTVNLGGGTHFNQLTAGIIDVWIMYVAAADS